MADFAFTIIIKMERRKQKAFSKANLKVGRPSLDKPLT